MNRKELRKLYKSDKKKPQKINRNKLNGATAISPVTVGKQVQSASKIETQQKQIQNTFTMDMDTSLLLPSPPATPPLRDNKEENVSPEMTHKLREEIDLQSD